MAGLPGSPAPGLDTRRALRRSQPRPVPRRGVRTLYGPGKEGADARARRSALAQSQLHRHRAPASRADPRRRRGRCASAEVYGHLAVAVREKVEEIIGMAGTAPSGSPPFTPRAKKVLELSLREALQLNHNYIGTEHILLGLVHEGEGVAATVLVSLGADPGRGRKGNQPLWAKANDRRAELRTKSIALLGVDWRQPSRSVRECRASVSTEARFRTIEVTSGAGNPDPMPIQVVYCVQCGTTLHMFKGASTS